MPPSIIATGGVQGKPGTSKSMSEIRTGKQAITIREASTEDRDAIADLLNRGFEDERPYFDGTTPQQVDEEMKEGTYLVGLDAQNRLAGCVYISRHPFANGYRRVAELGVESSLRSRGYGRQLMEAAEQLLRNDGCSGVKIGVLNFKQEQLFKFYRSLGYHETGDQPATIPAPKKPCHLIIMSKTLA